MIEVHTLWVGNSLSTLEVLALTSHIEVGHAVTLWAYGDVARVPAGVAVADAREVMPEADVFAYQTGAGAGSYSACSNLFRYKLLSERDVWWADADVVALKPFDFPGYFVFASERMQNYSFVPTTCVMKLPTVFAYGCYQKAKALAEDRTRLEWGTIGPKLLDDTIRNWPYRGISAHVQPAETFCPVNWFDSQYDPPVHQEVDLSESYAVHFWNEMWRRAGVDKDGEYPDTLYQKLKQRYLPTRRLML